MADLQMTSKPLLASYTLSDGRWGNSTYRAALSDGNPSRRKPFIPYRHAQAKQEASQALSAGFARARGLPGGGR